MNQCDLNVHVLKIGGSLSTVRGAYKKARPEVIRQIASAIAIWYGRHQRRVVVILGGGSFGHDVVDRFGIDTDSLHGSPENLFELTEALFEMKGFYARALQDQGVRAMPLQETILFAHQGGLAKGKGTLHLVDRSPLNACFASGTIPLVTGGVVSSESGFVTLSSDFIARPLAAVLPVQRVVMFTDRSGILRDGQVVERVNLDDEEAIFAHLDPPTRLDVTGGMFSKVEAAMELVRNGVEVLMADGRSMDAETLELAFSATPSGTLFVPAISHHNKD